MAVFTSRNGGERALKMYQRYFGENTIDTRFTTGRSGTSSFLGNIENTRPNNPLRFDHFQLLLFFVDVLLAVPTTFSLFPLAVLWRCASCHVCSLPQRAQ